MASDERVWFTDVLFYRSMRAAGGPGPRGYFEELSGTVGFRLHSTSGEAFGHVCPRTFNIPCFPIYEGSSEIADPPRTPTGRCPVILLTFVGRVDAIAEAYILKRCFDPHHPEVEQAHINLDSYQLSG